MLNTSLPRIIVLGLVTSAIACSSAPAESGGDAQPSSSSPPPSDGSSTPPAPSSSPAGSSTPVLTGTPIMATAAVGVGEQLLGTTVDAQFNQVSGVPIFKPRTSAGGTAPAQTTVNQITASWIQVSSTVDLAANLKGWGLASAELSGGSAHRYMSMRAYQVDFYEDVDLAAAAQSAPPGAVYFVSKIFFGHSYESLFSGESTTFSAAVAASLPKAEGSISVRAAELGITSTNVGRGLEPKDGGAIFAASQADVQSHYAATGPSVPIYIEYRLIPGASAPPGSPINWTSAKRATVAIDEIDVFHNGATFDATNTSWDISAVCKVNGATVSTGSLWKHNSVSAGGSKVADDGTGPQDPNTANATSTYGRYASLPFATTLPIDDGNVIQCDLSGNRTDGSTPIPLPPVSIVVNVDTSADVDKRARNFDVSAGLDYQVHYTVKYADN